MGRIAPVIIPRDHPRVKLRRNRIVEFGVIDADVTNWLRRHVKNGNWTRHDIWDFDPPIGVDRKMWQGFRYWFRDPNHAMLFKLSWVGQSE